jgi:hypothetical protein
MSRVKSRRTPNTKKVKSATASLRLFTLREFATLVDRAPATVSAWCEGGMPHKVPGKGNAGFQIKLEEALPWVLKYALEPPKESQRERLAREQADKFSLDNAKSRGELIDAEIVGGVLKDLASTVSGQLESIPSRCASEFAGISDPTRIHARLREEHRSVRASMAGIVGRIASACERAADDADTVVAATGQNTGSVGGPEARPA